MSCSTSLHDDINIKKNIGIDIGSQKTMLVCHDAEIVLTDTGQKLSFLLTGMIQLFYDRHNCPTDVINDREFNFC